MPAFLKLGDIKGQATDADHKDWIIIESMSAPLPCVRCGTFFPEAQIDLCATLGNRQEPYLQYKLKNVIVTSYSFHGNASGRPLPTEQVSLGYTDIEWNYIVLNPETGKKEGNVPAKYNPAKGQS